MGKRKGKEWKNSCYVVGFLRWKRMFPIRETYVSPCGNVRFHKGNVKKTKVYVAFCAFVW